MRLGDTIDITFHVREGTTLVDTDALDIYVRDPGNTETHYVYPGANVSRLSVGSFRLRFTIPEDAKEGTWQCRARSVGEVSGSGSTIFTVQGLWP